MPSDDPPEYRAKQKAHAEKIKTERTIMNMTGLNRSQVRRLQAFATQIQQRKAVEAGQVRVQEPPKIERKDMNLQGGGIAGKDEGVPRNNPVAQGQQIVFVIGVRNDDTNTYEAKEVTALVLAVEDLDGLA